MTREEAIKLVKEVTGMSLDWDDAHYDALQMAIKALEKEPCADAISRQSMLDYIKYLHGEMPEEEFVKALPSVTPACKKERWIPCSERLPKDDDDVIITTGFEIYVGWFDADDHTWRLRNDYITSIVAWMPLPEPYKAESEE